MISTLLLAALLPMGSPDSVSVVSGGVTNSLVFHGGAWSGEDVRVRFDDGRVRISAPSRGLGAVLLSWKADIASDALMLTDDWCGLGWGRIACGRASAWYFLVDENKRMSGCGVETRPNAIAYWQVETNRVALSLDVSAGGEDVRLGARELDACRLVFCEGRPGESAHAVGRRFCRMMCPNPRLPKEPVYGYNDWYCAYGANTATNFLEDAAYVSALAEGLAVRPYVVMDDGWQPMSPPEVQRLTGRFDSGWGPWDSSSERFGMDMRTFAMRISALGAKPGLWYRPLRAWDAAKDDLKVVGHPECFDPTVQENIIRIRDEVARFRVWGFKLVKADFLCHDVIGRYLFPGMVGPRLIEDGRKWRDVSRTTAERMKETYRAMREGAGDEMVIIGCGALGHLAAGIFEVNRVGFDTSGRDWAQTVRNGPSALAMRSIQHGAFYSVDADCVGLAAAGAIPWEKNALWMDLLARSKTAFFVSWRRSLADEKVRTKMRESFRIASEGGVVAEPLDWQRVASPRKWRFSDGTRTDYPWFTADAGKRIDLEGTYPGHLQDIWFENGTFWWAHTQYLVKTDLSGRILKKALVGGHHAGMVVHDGRLYSAVCAYNGEPRGQTTPGCHVMIGEYDAETLERIEMHVLDINDRAGSLCRLEDGTYLVGCLRHPALKPSEVKFHHVGRDFKLIGTHVVDVGEPVRLGIEVIRRMGNDVFLFIYGGALVRLDAKTFEMTGRFKGVGGQRGLAVDGDGAWFGYSDFQKDGAEKGAWKSWLIRRPFVLNSL